MCFLSKTFIVNKMNNQRVRQINLTTAIIIDPEYYFPLSVANFYRLSKKQNYLAASEWLEKFVPADVQNKKELVTHLDKSGVALSHASVNNVIKAALFLCISIPFGYNRHSTKGIICQLIDWEMMNSKLIFQTFFDLCPPTVWLTEDDGETDKQKLVNYNEKSMSFLALMLRNNKQKLKIVARRFSIQIYEQEDEEIIKEIKDFVFNRIVVFSLPKKDV